MFSRSREMRPWSVRVQRVANAALTQRTCEMWLRQSCEKGKPQGNRDIFLQLRGSCMCNTFLTNPASASAYGFKESGLMDDEIREKAELFWTCLLPFHFQMRSSTSCSIAAVFTFSLSSPYIHAFTATISQAFIQWTAEPPDNVPASATDR